MPVQAQRSTRARSLRLLLTLAAPGVAACSFFSPSYDEFASGSRSVGGEAGLAPDAGGAPTSSQGGGAGAGGRISTGGAGTGAETSGGGALAEAGAGGVIDDTPDPDPVRGQSVPVGELVLDQVVDTGLTSFAPLVRYDIAEQAAAAASQPPLYQPYDPTAPAFWDNLVAELLQARVTNIGLPTRGAFSVQAGDLTGPGNENPRLLSGWQAAVDRANADDLFGTFCVVDTPYLQQLSNTVHGASTATTFDWSVAANWSDIIWARTIEPWFQTVPSSTWYQPQGNPMVQFSALPSAGFVNASGNLSAMLTAVAASFNTAYGTIPLFVLDATWFAADPSLTDNQYVGAKSPWLVPSTSSSASSSFGGFTTGTLVPGFSAPAIPRHTVDPYNNPETTLLTNLGNAAQSGARFAILQGFTNYADSAGLYRSNAGDWKTPNEYLNLVRRFNDPKTRTLRLEAEGCDSYSDTTPGNSGNTFRRSGDLDVRALDGSGWAVTGTTPGEWIEFDNVDFSAGNYKFVAEYATGTGLTPGDGPRIELVVDGVKLAPVILDKTVNADSFANTLLGQQTMAHGAHTLRVRFLDGLVDLDWLFIEKIDSVVSLQAGPSAYLSAPNAGNGVLSHEAPGANIWESFTLDDLNGGALVNGDQVYIQTYDGLYVTMGAGESITTVERQPSDVAKFTIRVQGGGGAFVAGAKVALQTSDMHYLTAAPGDVVDASATSVGANQTFVLGF